MRLLVSMGLRRTGRPEEPLRACLREVDPDRATITRELWAEVDPRHTPGPSSHQEATCAAFDDDGRVLQPAHTELWFVDPVRLAIERRVSHPLFHGLHSATPDGEGVLLTCAGTESVLRVDRRGELLEHHWLRDGRYEDAYPGITDFRLVDHDALKPHSHHPNHAVRHEGELWATCFETQACHGLVGGGRIELPEAIPHDGRPRGGLLWFTQVTGRVVAVDPRTGERALELDLRELRGTRHMLGWCRGIEVVGSRLFVGMTVLRATRHREVLRQLLLGEAGTKLPTRLVEIDLDGPRLVQEIPLGNEAGGTIYGVLHLG
ncbi:MAG: hypothetical protein H6738_07690 [Alphaproteobacteria bacterium]|nr:hypothetical protein [Alphaproteobacteria bacterium]MCB9696647.1 hypothetical protein [Alphaproteobacteria bacterium]